MERFQSLKYCKYFIDEEEWMKETREKKIDLKTVLNCKRPRYQYLSRFVLR